MFGKNKLLLILSYISITLLILYLKFKPIIISPVITDIFFCALIILIILPLVWIAFHSKFQIDILLLMPLCVILIFLIRAVPNIVLEYPLYADQYYHTICTFNVIEYGTIESQLGYWYSQTDLQLNWPTLHILSSELSLISNSNLFVIIRWIMPFMGILLFLGIYSLSYNLLRERNAAILSALIGTTSATTIFYQSEYHPQGFAITLFIFLLIGFFNTRSNGKTSFVITTLIFIFAFTLSHHFSTIFLCLVFGVALIFSIIIRFTPIINKKYNFLSTDTSFYLIIIISILSYYLYTDIELLKYFFTWSLELTPIIGDSESIEQPLISVLFSSTKWIPIIIVLLYSPIILRNNIFNHIRVLYLVLIISSVGLLSIFLFFIPLDRMLAMTMPVIAILCGISLFEYLKKHGNKIKIKRIVIIIISLSIVGGILGAHIPAFYFQSSEPNSYYWYNNDLPNAIETPSAGIWIMSHSDTNKSFGVTSVTRSIPFIYGKISDTKIHLIDYNENSDYIIINKEVYYLEKTPKATIIQKYCQVYSGPSVGIYAK